MACSNLEPQKENSVLISTGKFNYKINFWHGFGGNPSNPSSYTYKWMYKPTYAASTTYIPVSPGMCVTNVRILS